MTMQRIILIDNSELSGDIDAHELYSALYENSEALVCLIRDNQIVDLNSKCLVFFGYENTPIDKLVLLENLSLEVETEETYKFSAITKKGLDVKGRILKSALINHEFYFGFIEVLYINGLEDYEVALDKISRTLAILKEFHSS